MHADHDAKHHQRLGERLHALAPLPCQLFQKSFQVSRTARQIGSSMSCDRCGGRAAPTQARAASLRHNGFAVPLRWRDHRSVASERLLPATGPATDVGNARRRKPARRRDLTRQHRHQVVHRLEPRIRILRQRPLHDRRDTARRAACRSGSAVRCFISTSPTLSPSNGTVPVSISNRMMPSA